MATVMTHKMAAVARNHGKFARAETHVLQKRSGRGSDEEEKKALWCWVEVQWGVIREGAEGS